MFSLHHRRCESDLIMPSLSRCSNPQTFSFAPGCRELQTRPVRPLIVAAVLLAVLFALTSCSAPAGQGSDIPAVSISEPTSTDTFAGAESTSTAVPPAPYAPTAPLPPAPTLTALAALTVIPVPTQIPGLQATHIARATSSPIPTSETGALQTGPPLVASARRAGISLELRLAGDSYLAGENGRAQVTLRNDSSLPLFAGNIQLLVRDEADHAVDLWPLLPGPRAGWPGQNRFGGMLRPLEPGQSISQTLTFQVPAAGAARGHTYTAQAAAQLSRADIQHPDRSDNVPADVQTAPVTLRIVESAAQQRLKAELQANRQGYTLRVTNSEGQRVAGPVWGAIEVTSGRGSISGPLQDSLDGIWSSGWAEYLAEQGSPLDLRAWVAARGYVPATIRETVPGTGFGNGKPAPPTPNGPVPTSVPAGPTSTVLPDP